MISSNDLAINMYNNIKWIGNQSCFRISFLIKIRKKSVLSEIDFLYMDLITTIFETQNLSAIIFSKMSCICYYISRIEIIKQSSFHKKFFIFFFSLYKPSTTAFVSIT